MELFSAMKEQVRHISSIGYGFGKTGAIADMDALIEMAEQEIAKLREELAAAGRSAQEWKHESMMYCKNLDGWMKRAEAAEELVRKARERYGFQPEFLRFRKENCGCLYAEYEFQLTDCGGEWEGGAPILYAEPIPPADVAELQHENKRLKQVYGYECEIRERRGKALLEANKQIAELERKVAEQRDVLNTAQSSIEWWMKAAECTKDTLAKSRAEGYEQGKRDAVPEGKIFNVFHAEEFVGTFYQGSFSTRELAEQYVANNKYGFPIEEMEITEYVVDVLLAAPKQEVKP